MSASTLHLETELSRSAPVSRAKQFLALTKGMALRGDKPGDIYQVAAGLGDEARQFAQKAAGALNLGDAWGSEGGRALAQSYIASIAPGSLLDQIARGAVLLPPDLRRVVVALGASSDLATEGEPKMAGSVDLTFDTMPEVKPIALAAYTRELLNVTGGDALFRRELTTAVLRATNSAVLSLVPVGLTVPASGDALADLRAGLAALAPSSFVVVAAVRAVVADLATRLDGRVGLSGGEPFPGCVIVPIDADTSSASMVLLPADRMALHDHGLSIRSATHATLTFQQPPPSPDVQVSLFQTGSVGLLVERPFRLQSADSAVAVA